MPKHYKIAFCGLGSIGRRHLKNTVKYLREIGCTYQIDAIRSGCGAELDAELAEYITDYYNYKDDVADDYDIIFITNPTAMHTDCILKYENCAKAMFIEKPLTDDVYFDVRKVRADLVSYVACPLRYTEVLRYVRDNIACDAAYSVRAICSTYLPNWHPKQDYRTSYSAHRDMGGGVSIDLIHEWDFLAWLFGMPDKVSGIRSKVSALEIDSDDIAVYIGSSEKRIYELHLDYFGKREIRALEIYLPDETVLVDILNKSIVRGNGTEVLHFDEDRDEFQLKEIRHFFDIYEGKCASDNDLAHAMEVLRIARNS